MSARSRRQRRAQRRAAQHANQQQVLPRNLKTVSTNGAGEPCPKCGEAMARRQHPPGWQPKPDQPFYFSEWGYCRPCGHTQLYERCRVYVDAAEVLAESSEGSAADIALTVLADMERAAKAPADRFIPERFRTMKWRPHWVGGDE